MQVLALLTAIAAPSPARASDTEIVVEGSRSAYADVVITEYLSLPEAGQPHLSSDGDLAGLLIEPLEVDYPGHAAFPVFGSVMARGFDSVPVRLFASGDLPPGRYRFWFFADAPATAVLKVSGSGFTLRPRNFAHARLATRGTHLPAGPSYVEHEYAVGVPKHAYALLGVRATGVRAENTYACASNTRNCRPPLLPVHVPSTETQSSAVLVPPAGADRDAVIGVNGVRAQDGDMSSLVLSFAP